MPLVFPYPRGSVWRPVFNRHAEFLTVKLSWEGTGRGRNVQEKQRHVGIKAGLQVNLSAQVVGSKAGEHRDGI